MNFYPFHLGDYASHTAHLEPLEDLAYRRMLDVYYLREGPLPADAQEVARLIRMRQNVAEVETVLREFFEPTDAGWSHARCDQEIERMQDKQAKARASAAASVNARKAKAQPAASGGQADAERTLSERSADVELPIPTPIPIPKKEKKNASVLAPAGVCDAVWADFLKLRQARRAPLSNTALAGIINEAEKAGITLEEALKTCCQRGWQSFRADWAKKPVATGQPSKYAGAAAAIFEDATHV